MRFESVWEVVAMVVFLVAIGWALSTVIRGIGPGPGDGGEV